MSGNVPGRPKGPPCKVCGDEASGFHYGVDSCEGCKGFFRRCLTQGMTHRCAVNENCEITQFSRNSCQFCRLKKCYQVGMSREASRLGRRPKRLKELQDALAQQRQAKENMATMHYAPLKPSSMSLTDLQGFVNAMNGSGSMTLMPSPVFQFDKPFNGLAKPSASHLPMMDLDEGPGQPGGFYRNMQSLTDGRQPVGDWPLPSIPGAIMGHLFPNSTDMQVKCFKGLQFSPNDVSRAMVTENNCLSSAPGRCCNKCEVCSRNAIGYIDRDGRVVLTAPLSSGDFLRTLHLSPSSQKEPQTPDWVFLDTGAVPADEQVSGESLSPPETGATSVEPNSRLTDEVSDFEDASCGAIQAEPACTLSASLQMLAEESKTEPSDERMQLIEHVILMTVEAHMNTCHYTADKLADGIKRYKESVSKDPRLLSIDQMKPSMDMKGDPSSWWEEFVKNMVPVIKRVVSFSKKLPGFTELSQDDQIALIKQGSFEVILTRYTRLFSSEGMFLPDMTMRIPRQMVKKMPLGDFFEEQFKFAEIFNKLRLNDEETALLTGVMIMNPDREGLMNSKAVYKLQGLYLQALYIYMQKSRPDSHDASFDETIASLPLLGWINEVHSQKMKDMKMSSPDFKLPELHKEVFDGPGP